jgi:uncharacterized OsmC-like protein
MLEYAIEARWGDRSGSKATAKDAELVLDTSLAGQRDAFNPAELLLAACMIKNIERVAPVLNFGLRGVEISLHASRQGSPPKIIEIDYVLSVDTDESDQRLDLLHRNIRKYGTISNTVASAARLDGTVRRQS